MVVQCLPPGHFTVVDTKTVVDKCCACRKVMFITIDMGLVSLLGVFCGGLECNV